MVFLYTNLPEQHRDRLIYIEGMSALASLRMLHERSYNFKCSLICPNCLSPLCFVNLSVPVVKALEISVSTETW